MQIRKLFSELMPFINAYKKLDVHEFKKPMLVIISSSFDAFNELAAFLGADSSADLSWIDFKQITDLNEEVALKIEKADLVMIYSNDPLAEAGGIAFAGEIVRMLTFRYLIILYGKGSDFLAGLISESSRINPCKIRAVKSRFELLEELYSLPVKLLPLETLPGWLDFRLYDGRRMQMTVRLLLFNLLKIIVLFAAFPVAASFYLDDFLALFSGLIEKIDRSKKIYKYGAFVPLFIAKIFRQKRRRTRGGYLTGILLLAAAVFFSLLDTAFED